MIVDSLFMLLPLFFLGYVWSLFCCALMRAVSFFCNHLAGEERCGCFTLIAP